MCPKTHREQVDCGTISPKITMMAVDKIKPIAPVNM